MQSLPDHVQELRVRLLGGESRAQGYRLDGLLVAPHLTRQRGLVGGEQPLEYLDLDFRDRPRKAVRKPVQGVCEVLIDEVAQFPPPSNWNGIEVEPNNGDPRPERTLRERRQTELI